MSVPRFYCPITLPDGGLFDLPAAAAHHATRVLRMREGDAAQIFDGAGQARHARVNSIQGKHVEVQIIGSVAQTPPSSLRITLAQAMTSSDKMDWIVQKAVELGAAAVQTVQTQRSVAKLTQERADKRSEHWQGVVIAACEQSGRNDLMPVHAPQDLGLWLASQRGSSASKFILHPQHAVALHAQARPQRDVTLLIGPEGGFSDDELKMAQQAGFIAILLGPRILRTETAALAGIAALQTLWGEFT